MPFLRDALVTAVALLLAFAAFDDITTDNATTFTLEYTLLVACAVWLSFVALNLVRQRHHVLGIISFAALAGALWGQRAIRPGSTPDMLPEFVVMTAVYGWFWALCLIMAWWARRPSGQLR